MARIGMFLNLRESDPETPGRREAFQEGLGRTDVDYDFCYGEGDYDRYGDIARDLIGRNPDLLVATCGPTFWALQQNTKTIPIVFTSIIDPVRTGRVPGPNSWGSASYGVSQSATWLTYLKQMAPNIERVAVVADFHIDRPAATEEAIEIRDAAGSVSVRRLDLKGTDDEIASAIEDLAGEQNGGLIVPTGTLAGVRRDLIIRLATEHRLPAIYGNRLYVKSGGLFSYGPPTLVMYKEAGAYAARILNNESIPARVQMNDRFELVINPRAAAAIALPVPPELLSQADEIIDAG